MLWLFVWLTCRNCLQTLLICAKVSKTCQLNINRISALTTDDVSVVTYQRNFISCDKYAEEYNKSVISDLLLCCTSTIRVWKMFHWLSSCNKCRFKVVNFIGSLVRGESSVSKSCLVCTCVLFGHWCWISVVLRSDFICGVSGALLRSTVMKIFRN
jgi:hypothetical protein